MRPLEQWIWLPEDLYPNRQTSRYCIFTKENEAKPFGEYTVTEIFRKYSFPKKICKVNLRFSADCAFLLYCNDTRIAGGPVCSPWDFLEQYVNDPTQSHYATEVTLTEERFPSLSEGILNFYAQVRMGIGTYFDASMGHGGFFLTATVFFEDGTKKLLLTDQSWQIRQQPAGTRTCLCADHSQSLELRNCPPASLPGDTAFSRQ